ncbi:putative histone deacetylase [Helianthus annuus]|nr:putative histone deacetylase [Helianthus annuus]
MKFSGGKIVMALEGGYNLNSYANSVVACIEVLLDDKPIAESVEGYPFESTWRVIKAVRSRAHGYIHLGNFQNIFFVMHNNNCHSSAHVTFVQVREELSAFWPVLVDKSPEELDSLDNCHDFYSLSRGKIKLRPLPPRKVMRRRGRVLEANVQK